MRSIPLFIAVFSAWAILPSAAHPQDSASEWLTDQLKNLQQIRSIEFVTTRKQDAESHSFPPGAPVDPALIRKAPSELTMKFVSNGICLRVETGDENTIAFDGTTLRTLRDSGRAFGESVGLPDGPIVSFPHPILWAYRWARPLNSYGDISALQDDANWEPLIESSRVLPSGMVEVTRIDGNGNGYVFEIERGPDGRLHEWAGYRLPGRNPEGRITILESVVLTDQENQAVWLPVSVRVDTGKEEFVTIDPSTLKLNHDIDPDVFIISRFEAQELLPVSDAAFAADSTKKVQPASNRTLLVIALNGAAIIAGLIYWRFQRKSRRDRTTS